jgi:hypothetical protein
MRLRRRRRRRIVRGSNSHNLTHLNRKRLLKFTHISKPRPRSKTPPSPSLFNQKRLFKPLPRHRPLRRTPTPQSARFQNRVSVHSHLFSSRDGNWSRRGASLGGEARCLKAIALEIISLQIELF